jgi:hypothetical protein
VEITSLSTRSPPAKPSSSSKRSKRESADGRSVFNFVAG